MQLQARGRHTHTHHEGEVEDDEGVLALEDDVAEDGHEVVAAHIDGAVVSIASAAVKLLDAFHNFFCRVDCKGKLLVWREDVCYTLQLTNGCVVWHTPTAAAVLEQPVLGAHVHVLAWAGVGVGVSVRVRVKKEGKDEVKENL